VAYTDPREGESRAVRSHGNQAVKGSTVTLGLIAAPDIPEKIAQELASELPDLLSSRVDGGVSWDVAVVVDPLTGTDRQAPEILDECQKKMLSEGWEMALCLTDLPVYRGGRLVAADISSERGVGCLSLPAMGALRLPQRSREATLRLAQELYEKVHEPEAEATHPKRSPHSSGFVGPFRRIDPPDEDMKAMDVDARFAATGLFGRIGLWSGMVLANRPWRMLPAFKGAIAAAFATGAYALVITTLWILSDSVGFWRLLLLMVTAIVAMVVWIIVAHHLWERPEDPDQQKWAALYNGVTVLTISSAVLLAYAALFALILLAAWVFVPGAYFQSILKHPVGFGEYLTLSWLAASLATVAGALGASPEDEETVRKASYGYRQRRRHDGENPEEKSGDGLDER
jgi:hypothetical protein